ncbi:hypothetical protein, partial [Streptomyces erythrochromogenes]|uniref:hypothetical protein n=1 Tax=Streptomyces erythrochromogenes TaxID=285574 RepID=UPI00368951AB
MLTVSFDRGGIRHPAVLQVTSAVWSAQPVSRTVQVRGARDPGTGVKWFSVVIGLVLAGAFGRPSEEP